LFGRFFAATADTHPQELKLLQMLMSEWRAVVPVEEALHVVPAAMRLLDRARQALDEATVTGAMNDAPAMDRVIIWAAGMSGIMQVSRLEEFDTELFDGQRLALQFLLDMFVGWGADRAALDRVGLIVDGLAARSTLAPSAGQR